MLSFNRGTGGGNTSMFLGSPTNTPISALNVQGVFDKVSTGVDYFQQAKDIACRAGLDSACDPEPFNGQGTATNPIPLPAIQATAVPASWGPLVLLALLGFLIYAVARR